MNKNWVYYNHALVPTTAPHEDPDLKALGKDIWNFDGNKVLLVRYTTDFDYSQETGFWYIIKEGPFDIDGLDKKYKKNIARALERTEARQIDPCKFTEEIWAITEAAFSKYENAGNRPTREGFEKVIMQSQAEWWAAFNKTDGRMVGWMSCMNHGTWTETQSSKYHPDFQGWNRPSDVLHFAILNHYLNELKQRYICSGTRNIIHKTNVQDYKIKNWKFRRAYCKLHLIYNPKVRWMVKLFYPFRKFFCMLDSITFIHQINSLMLLEEVARVQKC